MPGGVPYIVGNEAAERFSFYGMRSILIIFMTTSLMNGSGRLAVMDKNEAAGWFHQFVAAVYFLPILGAIISDGMLGKYRTILCLSIVYCCGHLALALNDTRMGLFLGLFLIALGAGRYQTVCLRARWRSIRTR
jgi:proton-dependent oligopeptide transporter, POT family